MNAARIDESLLRGWPLPPVQEDGDKESRGRVLVLAGSREMPGAAVLAATAALRAGAGKLVVATVQAAAQSVAAALPEARVIALPENADGSPAPAGVQLLQAIAGDTGALLVGPGMIGAGTPGFIQGLLPLFQGTTVVLDALAMDALEVVGRFAQPVILTPHAGEMAHLTGHDKEDLGARPLDSALRGAAHWNAVVVLKGATTAIAMPDGQAWMHHAQAPGLGTSGSGDVLAGLITGLAARGATLQQAAAWGVALHARAGELLGERMGTIGYLARELAAQVPPLLQAWSH
jgi:hydroxyethylthiazole kinase-like uncharacterized protein yjeF